ncbi:flagellar filament capping protein FliD [Tissierella sp.]|uniref:flagellar filament capping protein FliD n=1 Tax=Tissierella sp. TaxID=41274 RepID=UPI002866A6D5|nr:flagellar filament capping protein FliD [Tissierella sp.]MDR7856880.1 flagellar filament capping protein FliD [Tissierella sp.]
MSNMRVSGMYSGMDTDAMVQSLMKVERMKVDRFEQSKQVALWRQEGYNSVNKLYANFILNTKKDIGLKTSSSTGSLFDTSYTNLSYVRKATSSNEAAATISSTSKAVNGSFSIEVKELAKGASFTSAKLDENALVGIKHMEFNLTSDNIKIEVGSTVGTTDITMDDVVKSINAKTEETGVTAFYDKTNGRLFMQTTETGKDAYIGLTAVTGNAASVQFINKLKNNIKEQNSAGEGHTGAIYSLGKDSKISFNGVDLTYSSNNFTLNGLNIEAKSIGTTNINVSTNVDGIMEKIEKLVSDYNALIDASSLLLNEKKYSSYHPLSAEEKSAMKDDDVKLWTEKAKSGLLNNDETINRTLQSMRNDLYKTLEGVDEKYNHITKIGISTESYARGSAGGKLQIDTEKLRKAIEEDPEGVMELLFKDGSYDADGKEILGDAKNSSKGIFTRVYDDLITGMKSIIDKSGPGSDSDLLRSVKSNMLLDFVTKKSSISDIDKSIAEMNQKIDNLNILFAKKEESYYAKFTQMEKYMQQMSSQSGWLSQQFG